MLHQNKFLNCISFAGWAILACLTQPLSIYADEGDSADSHTKLVKSKDVGRQWQLMDYRSKKYLSKDLEGKVHIIAFLGTQCPLAKLYSGRLEAIQQEYAPNEVVIIAIDSNEQDSLAEIAAFAKRQALTYPVLKDPDAAVAEQYGATRTPQVFLIDKAGKIRYSGRIDDQYVIGNIRQEPQHNELRDALDAVLNDQVVQVARTEAMGCLIGRKPKPKINNEVTYAQHVAPLMQARCVDCHRAGDIGPMQLDNYDDVAAWADMIQEVTSQRRMPPWHADPKVGHFANDRSLQADEVKLLQDWVAGGCQPGDLSSLPAPKAYTVGWQLPREPDLILNITEKPFVVPATGEIKYQYFVVDPKFTEDKWLQAAEIQPGNRNVVHHVLVFARQPNQKRDLAAERSYLTGYVPGTRFKPYPSGSAKKIEAGSVLVFQVHYTPIGIEQEDMSRIGLIFADDADITREIQTTSVVQPRISIPPHAENYEADAYLPELLPDCKLISMSPHMHLRGKSFTYELVARDGTRTPLLNVPNYDFNWQTAYELSEPKLISAGSRVYCKATYDNSANNIYNPDPNQKVRWGDQTDDEMMIGYFDISVPKTQSVKPDNSVSEANRQTHQRWDVNNDGALSKDELPTKYQKYFTMADSDRDGMLSVEEFDTAAKRLEQAKAGR